MQLRHLFQLSGAEGPIIALHGSEALVERYTPELLPDRGSDASPDCFVVAVGETDSATTTGLSGLGDTLAAAEGVPAGLILFEQSLVKVGHAVLSHELAEAGRVISLVAGLAYESLPWACVVRAGDSIEAIRPWPGSSGLEGVRELASSSHLRRLVNQWQLETFAHREAHEEPESSDGDDRASAIDDLVTREVNRVNSQRLAREQELVSRIRTLQSERQELRNRIRDITGSKAYRIGRAVGNATHDRGAMLRLPGQISTLVREAPYEPDLEPEAVDIAAERPPMHALDESFAVEGLSQGWMRFGNAGPQIVGVLTQARASRWGDVARVWLPEPEQLSLFVRELMPSCLVVEASALVEPGPWSGVGQGLEVRKSLAIFEAIDQARRHGIPSVFRWDRSRSRAPHAIPVANATDARVATEEWAGLGAVDGIVAPGVGLRSFSHLVFERREEFIAVVDDDDATAVDGLDGTITMAALWLAERAASALSTKGVLVTGGTDVGRTTLEAAAVAGAVVTPDPVAGLPGLAPSRLLQGLDATEMRSVLEELAEEAAGASEARVRILFREHSIGCELDALLTAAGAPDRVSRLRYLLDVDVVDAELADRYVRVVANQSVAPVAVSASGSAAGLFLDRLGTSGVAIRSEQPGTSSPLPVMRLSQDAAAIDSALDASELPQLALDLLILRTLEDSGHSVWPPDSQRQPVISLRSSRDAANAIAVGAGSHAVNVAPGAEEPATE